MTTARPRRVVVVGGGIGGLAAGLALVRSGHEVLVLERHAAGSYPTAAGGWHLWSNAMQALDTLGVGSEVRARAAHLETSLFLTAAGRPIASWPIGEIGRRLQATDVGIRRDVLQDVLRTELRRLAGPGCLLDGTAVAAVESRDGRARVLDQHGAYHDADVVLGADGIRSTVRHGLVGEVAPRYAGYVQWQAVIPRTVGLAAELPLGTELVMFGRRARAVVHEVGDGHIFWAAILYGPASMRTMADPRDRLLARFEGFPEPLAELIAATPPEIVNGHAIHDLPPQQHWVDPVTALVGDAAHAMTTNLSQGACLALEDAVVLADCLGPATAATDVPAALQRYQQRRAGRAQPIARRSWRIAGLGGWRSAPAVRLRDQLMRLTLPTVALRDHERWVAAAP